MIAKASRHPIYMMLENPPYRILNDRLTAFFSLLHFRRCLSSNLHFRQFNGSARSNFHMCAGYGHVAVVFHLHQTIRSIVLIFLATPDPPSARFHLMTDKNFI